MNIRSADYSTLVSQFVELLTAYKMVINASENSAAEMQVLNKISRALFNVLLKATNLLENRFAEVKNNFSDPYLYECLLKAIDAAKEHPNNLKEMIDIFQKFFMKKYFKTIRQDNIFDMERDVIQLITINMANILVFTRRQLSSSQVRELNPELFAVLQKVCKSEPIHQLARLELADPESKSTLFKFKTNISRKEHEELFGAAREEFMKKPRTKK